MQAAVWLTLAASICTATASLAQRQGAKTVQTTGRFDIRLMLRLARRPVWLLGIVSMIGGFGFQLTDHRQSLFLLLLRIADCGGCALIGCIVMAGFAQYGWRVSILWLTPVRLSASGVTRPSSPPGGGVDG